MMSNGLQFKSLNICFKVVKCNQKGILCDHCLCSIHQKCARLTYKEFENLGSNNESWFCGSCLKNIFPFNNIINNVHFILSTTNTVLTQ